MKAVVIGNVCSTSYGRALQQPVYHNRSANVVLLRNQSRSIKVLNARNDLPSAKDLGLSAHDQSLHLTPEAVPSSLEFPNRPFTASAFSANGKQGELSSQSNSEDPSRRESLSKSLQHLKAEASSLSDVLQQPPEAGILPDDPYIALDPPPSSRQEEKMDKKEKAKAAKITSKKLKAAAKERGATPVTIASALAPAVSDASTSFGIGAGVIYPPEERSRIKTSWESLMRWSRFLRNREASFVAQKKLEKVVVFGGGSFGTAMGVSLALSYPSVQVVLLLRDAYLCKDINDLHVNTRYLPTYTLPPNVTATTSAVEAITGAQYAIHAVPVQHTRAFLDGIKDILPSTVPIISVSKGVEVTTGKVMSDLIPSALGRKQPAAFLSGPSFAKEVMEKRPTGIVAASKDAALARDVQQLFASPSMRVNTSNDVIGVEVCGALKNVLAIAAGIVEGLNLGQNAMAALVSQGCAEIRWLATKMGAKPATVSGLSGLGDIMLTCYGSLSRNRTVGVRLGQGEKLADIIASSSQVAEGVATAGVVVSLAVKYKVQLPVLTAVAQVLDGNISAREAVFEIMNLPQIEER